MGAATTSAFGLTERAPRSSVFLFAAMETAGARLHVRVRNVSESGMLVETAAEPPNPGSRISLSRHKQRIEGEVVWVKEGRMGIRFDRPLDPDHQFRTIDETMAWFQPRCRG